MSKRKKPMIFIGTYMKVKNERDKAISQLNTLKHKLGEETRKEDTKLTGEWHSLDECSNAGVYCSRCNKKVYGRDHIRNRIKLPFCPNCGSYNGHTVITEEMRRHRAICGGTGLPCVYCNSGCEYRKEILND